MAQPNLETYRLALPIPLPRRSRQSQSQSQSQSQPQSHHPHHHYSHQQPQQQQPPPLPSLDAPLPLSTPRKRHLASLRPRPRRISLPPSTEVISSLITSLSDFSPSHIPSTLSPSTSVPGSSVPSSPHDGSFGVDYGAYSHPSHFPPDPALSLDELAAAPPIIRTAKPPSGFSVLTAPKPPAAAPSTRDPFSPSLKSLTSRPSSRASAPDRDDSYSIGNLSIERFPIATADNLNLYSPSLRKQRSFDSWGRKQARNSRGLTYMTSKEHLSEREHGRIKRAAADAVGGTPDGLGFVSAPVVVSTDYSLSTTTFMSSLPKIIPTTASTVVASANFALAATSIIEEPSSSPNGDTASSHDTLSPGDAPLSPRRPIPTRDSSLRKTGRNARRLSTRRDPATRSRRTHDPLDDAGAAPIPEEAEHISPQRSSSLPHSLGSSAAVDAYRSPLDDGSLANVTHNSSVHSRHSSRDVIADRVADLDDDGAPFPAVAQGPATHSSARCRLPGTLMPDPTDSVRIKRSTSRLKRLSGASGARSDDAAYIPSLDVPSARAVALADQNRQHHKAEQQQQQSHQNRYHQLPAGYERPHSPDSIDDAVESYLCSPRLSQRVRHPQSGRVVSFSEVGDPQGSAVFCCVGMGLTRYITAFYDELALTLKLRLITPDRPGVGDSGPYTDGTATPLGWPDDVYAICQALKITKFSILAHSAGAIYALATALRMPQHIRGRIHLLAPWIPPSQMNVFGASQTLPPTKAIPTSQRILRALPTPILKAANSSFMTATSSSITSSLPKSQRRSRRKTSSLSSNTPFTPAALVPVRLPSPEREGSDRYPVVKNASAFSTSPRPAFSGIGAGPVAAPSPSENMDRICPSTTLGGGSSSNNADAAIIIAAADALAEKERQLTYDNRLTHAIWELATAGANPAVDLLVCLERQHTIGFRYVDITRPVVIHHGSRDNRVPVENVRWLGKMMRRCEVRVLEGEGHGLMASAVVMGAVLMEMSKEWEDWIRVTNSAQQASVTSSSATFSAVRRVTAGPR